MDNVNEVTKTVAQFSAEQLSLFVALAAIALAAFAIYVVHSIARQKGRR